MFSTVLLNDPSDGIAAEADCNFDGLRDVLLYELLNLVLAIVVGAAENPFAPLAKMMQGMRATGNLMSE